MKTQKLNYQSPETEVIRFSLERNFCASADVNMSDTVFDNLEIIVPDIW